MGTLIISNEEINDIMTIVNSTDLVIKGVSETIENEAKEQKGGSLGMLLGILGASLLGNLLTGKGVIRSECKYFDIFRVEHIKKEIKKFLKNKNIKTSIYRIQADDSIICGYFCIGFIDFMLKGKSFFLLVYFLKVYFLLTSMKNDKIILKYFQ